MFCRTLLLLGVVHADFEDGRPLVAHQSDSAGGRVQLVNAAASILIPKQEVFVVAQPEGVVQLLTLVHRLAMREEQQGARFNKQTTALASPKLQLGNILNHAVDEI